MTPEQANTVFDVPFLANPCPVGWEVTGCESRAEAGAAFYGHDPRGGL